MLQRKKKRWGTFPRTKLFDLFEKLKNCNFPSFSNSCHFTCIWCFRSLFCIQTMFLQFKNTGLAIIRFVVSIFWNLKLSPKINHFLIILPLYIHFANRPFLPSCHFSIGISREIKRGENMCTRSRLEEHSDTKKKHLLPKI